MLILPCTDWNQKLQAMVISCMCSWAVVCQYRQLSSMCVLDLRSFPQCADSSHKLQDLDYPIYDVFGSTLIFWIVKKLAIFSLIVGFTSGWLPDKIWNFYMLRVFILLYYYLCISQLKLILRCVPSHIKLGSYFPYQSLLLNTIIIVKRYFCKIHWMY